MKEKTTCIAAAILAGGKNSRMEGENKAFLRVNGALLIERNIGLLKEIFEEVIIVTNSPQDFKSYKHDSIIVEDIIRDAGPLGGLHSGLSATEKEAVFFVACDMPFLHNALIRSLLEYFKGKDCDCLVPRIGAFLEPLHAIYKKSLKDNIDSFLKNGSDNSIKSFLRTVNVCYWNLEDNPSNRKAFKNLNTKKDFMEAKGIL